jgi:regulator of protease activity HflC (stomatin/prohibitin superfamily)
MIATLIAIAVTTTLAAVLTWRALVRTVVVYEGYAGVLYRRGVVARVLEPGLHRVGQRHTRLHLVDLRPQYATVAGQEVLTADGIGLRVSVVAVYRVADVMAVVSTPEPYQALHLTLQLALREVAGSASMDDLLARRGELDARLVEVASAPLAALGLQLQSADIKDLMFPGELRRVFAQVAEARQEGLAALERARGETAALRNLANAARAVADNPALLQLRMLQVMESSTGNTFVLGRGEGLST